MPRARNNLPLRLTALAALAAAGPLGAYVPYYDGSGELVVKWQTPSIPMEIMLPTTNNLSDGSSQSSTVVAAMQAWNAKMSAVQFAPHPTVARNYATGNGVNEVAMDSTVGGDAFPSGALAITLHYQDGNAVVEADVVFNRAYSWDSYRGLLRPGKEEMRRVAIHELGHALGLDHPDLGGQSVTALMNSRESDIDSLQTDDVAGIQMLYGAPGVVPANDAFASATVVSNLGETAQQWTVSNTTATHQSGEPKHGASTGVHSLWWKWQAPRNGTLVADTRGSNFDSLLAVYTGSVLTALSPLIANDDEERVIEDLSEQRRRTSKVAFNAVGGTTYYLVVDGFGDDDTVPTGYTGSVTLNLRFSTACAPLFAVAPENDAVPPGGGTLLEVKAAGSPDLALQWRRNGVDVSGATQATLALSNLQPAQTGVYWARARANGAIVDSPGAIVGLALTTKTTGASEEIGSNITAANGKTYDQVALRGAAAAINADHQADQITRMSFLDPDGDIVQVEMSGPGTLSLVLDGVSGPAAPVKYSQNFGYMQGRAGIVIAEATENTNVTVFTVGRATANDPTGRYHPYEPLSATNDPANNGSPLFVGHAATQYDGVADIAFIAIASSNYGFGGIRTANARYSAERGITGIYAPGVVFTGPVYVGNVSARLEATPMLRLGAAADVRVTGGDMAQENGRPVAISGVAELKFTAGGDSHGHEIVARPNRGRFEEKGQDVTSTVVVNP